MNIDDVLNEISEKNSVYEKGNYNSLLLVISELEKDSNYQEVVDIIDENYSLFKEEDKRLFLLNKKIQSLIRIEDYNETLKTLLIKSSLNNLDNKEKANILFYEAISYEALNEIKKAIYSLESIEDDIPRIALVNKYLKLAILYNKDNRFDDANNAYLYANQMDPTHKNDIFSLVESDLYFSSGNYNKALEKFESFFLKSSAKYKYLDRYIYILMKLNRFNDAYNFYQEYKDKTSIRLSKINRYNFYVAASILLKNLNKYDELYTINSFIEDEEPTYLKELDSLDNKYLNNIMSLLSMPLSIYDKYKNIANKFFKVINDIPKDELIFIEKTQESFIYSKFNNTDLKPNVISNELLREKELYKFFNIESDKVLDYFYNHKLLKIESNVKAYVIKDDYHFYGYFLVSYSTDFDSIYDSLRKALLYEFIRLDEITKGKKNEISILKTLESISKGYIKIVEDRVELLNDYSKRLFDFKQDMMTFDLFKSFFKDELFVDTFVNKNTFTLEMKNDRIIEFSTNTVDDIINCIVSDVTTIKARDDLQKEYYYYGSLDFGNLNALKDIVDNIDDSYSILGLYLPIIEDDDLISKRDNKLKIVYNFLNKFSPSSNLYYLGENHFLYQLNTVDKRNIEAIFRNVKNGIGSLYRYSKSLREISSFGFASKNLKNKSFDAVKELIEYGFFVSSLENDYIILDNEEKKNYQIYRTYEFEVKKFIERRELDEVYYPIVNTETKQIYYFLQDFIYPYNLKHDTLEKIFKSEELTVKRDIYSFDVIINNLKKYNNKIRYIVRVHKESLLSPSFTDKLKNTNKEYINNIYLYIDTTDLTLYNDIINDLRAVGYHTAINIDTLNLKADYSMFKLVFSNLNTSDDINYKILKTLIDNKVNVCMTNKLKVDGALNLDNTIKPYTINEIKKL